MPSFCSFCRVAVLTLYVLAFLIGCARSGETQSQADPEEQNRQVVLAFYDQGLINLQPRAAFERYASEDFVEHKPGVAPNGERIDVPYCTASFDFVLAPARQAAAVA